MIIINALFYLHLFDLNGKETIVQRSVKLCLTFDGQKIHTVLIGVEEM